MIPIHLRVSGFLSYNQPAEIDFTGFNLACISGPNGAGKSSLLDAITWALFGQARRRDDALINARQNVAEVIFDFEYEGGVYRIQRAKQRDKSGMLDFFIQAEDGAWKPLTEHSLRETEDRIRDTLRMDYETFTNASFLLQGRADQFAQQRPGDRKRILSNILGLEKWEIYQKTAADRRKAVEQETTSLAGMLEEIDSELSEEPQRRTRLAELEADLQQSFTARSAQETAVDSLRRTAALIEEQKKSVQSAEQSLRQARQALETTQSSLSERSAERDEFALRVEHAQVIETAYAGWQASRADLQQWDSLAARFREHEKLRNEPLRYIESERARLEQEAKMLEAQQEQIQASAGQTENLQTRLKEILAAADEAQQKLARREELDRQIRDLAQSLADARAENPRLKAEMDALKERIETLGLSQGECPTCGQPLDAEHSQALVQELEAQGKSLGDRYRENQRLLREFNEQNAGLQKELQALSAAESELREELNAADKIANQLKQIEQQSADWQTTGQSRLDEIRRTLEASSFAQEAVSRLAQIDAALKEMGYDAAAHDALRRRELDGRASEVEFRRLENARAALAPLERTLADLQAQEKAQSAEAERLQENYDRVVAAYAAASANLPSLNEAERSLMNLREHENRVRMEVGAARQKVDVLAVQKQRAEELKARQAELRTQIARYKTLERAFSKDGVPALLIEQALPEIEGEANLLLERLSNGRMSVRFDTQKEYKDKNRDDKRETLEIVISDETGSREYEMFSGGEAFRVNFAIRLALSRVLARRAGARLQTLVIDEGFGSQDAEGRQRLVEAIQAVQTDFAKILVITHLEELKDAFPTRIEVEKDEQGSTARVV